MRIIGIDPGVATTGWAIVDFSPAISLIDFGIISTKKGVEHMDRLKEIHDDLNTIVNKFKPEYAGVELLIFNSNVKTAMAVGEARGVVLLALRNNDIHTLQFTPPQIKSSISGSGRADKKQVGENVKRLCRLSSVPKPDDSADAIAIAICCYDSIKMSKIEK